MNDQQKVVSFPKAPKMRRDITDAERVKNVRKAWRALQRAIASAENAGLYVKRDFNLHDDLEITRTFR